MSDVQKELTIIREYDAPREMVFKAWTDEKQVAQWWGPQGVFTPICEVDATPGGKLNIVMEAGEELGDYKGTQWPMEGTFEEVEEPSKLVFTSNAVSDGKELFQHRTTVTFDETEGKTKMTVHVAVTKMLPGSEFAIAGMEQGWNSQFDKLGEFVKKGTRE
ncbi:MAG TPA: SRPBCC domain-containing protein [Candidatus Saccharimonadales bacterium]|nr:SRPBCC domain-containing protein [Candidatus Saccharimonadales bacterium]